MMLRIEMISSTGASVGVEYQGAYSPDIADDLIARVIKAFSVLPEIDPAYAIFNDDEDE